MSRKNRPEPLLGPWEDATACCGDGSGQADQDSSDKDQPPRGGFTSSGDVSTLAQALKGRNAKARCATTEPGKRSRKKVGDVLSRILAGTTGTGR